VLRDSITLFPDVHTGSVTLQTDQHLIGRLAPPDSPPPRA
jgi:hypothetical protein